MKRCLIIINPSSGKHIIQNKLDRIIGQLTLQNIVEHFEIFYTKKKDDAYYKARDCDENQYDFIMSVGGDGTLNEVISGMVESHKKIPLCILAAGTVNDFANYLNIPSSVNGIVEMIKNFNVISSDVGKINDQYFINVAAAGMFSDISFVVSKEEKKKLKDEYNKLNSQAHNYVDMKVREFFNPKLIIPLSVKRELDNVLEMYEENMENDDQDIFSGTEDSYANEMLGQDLYDVLSKKNVEQIMSLNNNMYTLLDIDFRNKSYEEIVEQITDKLYDKLMDSINNLDEIIEVKDVELEEVEEPIVI